jgi:hypothetical protein
MRRLSLSNSQRNSQRTGEREREREREREFYSSAPTMVLAGFSSSVNLPLTASWKLAEKLGMGATVFVEVKEGKRTLGGQIHGEFMPSLQGIGKNGVPITDYTDVAVRIEHLCEHLKKSLLSNLSEEHMRLLARVTPGR